MISQKRGNLCHLLGEYSEGNDFFTHFVSFFVFFLVFPLRFGKGGVFFVFVLFGRNFYIKTVQMKTLISDTDT